MLVACVSTSRAERAPGNVLRQLSFLSLAKAWKTVHTGQPHTSWPHKAKKPTQPYLLLLRVNGLLVMDIWSNAFFRACKQSLQVPNLVKVLSIKQTFFCNKLFSKREKSLKGRLSRFHKPHTHVRIFLFLVETTARITFLGIFNMALEN